ncbi:MAG: hypothetical protein C0393_03135 [Anaerolinea sp.]|nr:hypothetical protein [Anaerolinea sp.]
MLTVSEAQQRILSHFEPLEVQTLPLDQTAGRVLAEDICATVDLPPFDNSSMDGFALRTADTQGSNSSHPVTLSVVADIPAGNLSYILIGPGQAARIMTGAPIPARADAVVKVEDTDHSREPGAPAPEAVSVYQPSSRAKTSAIGVMTFILVRSCWRAAAACAPRTWACWPCSEFQSCKYIARRAWPYFRTVMS